MDKKKALEIFEIDDSNPNYGQVHRAYLEKVSKLDEEFENYEDSPLIEAAYKRRRGEIDAAEKFLAKEFFAEKQQADDPRSPLADSSLASLTTEIDEPTLPDGQPIRVEGQEEAFAVLGIRTLNPSFEQVREAYTTALRMLEYGYYPEDRLPGMTYEERRRAIDHAETVLAYRDHIIRIAEREKRQQAEERAASPVVPREAPTQERTPLGSQVEPVSQQESSSAGSKAKKILFTTASIVLLIVLALFALQKMYHDATDSIDRWSGLLHGCSASESIEENGSTTSSAGSVNTGETTYQSKEAGFTASFPSEPATIDRTDELDEGSAYASYLVVAGGNEVEFTSVEVMEYSRDIVVDLDDIPEDELTEVMENSLNSFIVTFSHLKPVNSSRTTHFSSIDGYRCASFVEPFSLQLDDGSEIPVVYGYCLDLMTESRLYHMSGVRESEEEARKALESFDLS